MRVPFPERIPLDRAAVFALLLMMIQMVEGTALYFSMGCVAFILLATLAFNAGGGLTRVAGVYVFFYSMLVVIVGVCYKAVLGEPGESNLATPQTDIAVYVGGMAAMLAAVVVSRRLSRPTGLLQNMLKQPIMYRACMGALLFGIAGPAVIGLLGNRQLGSTFAQLNELVPLAIIVGTMYEVRRSGGTRSLSTAVLIGIGYVFFIGMVGFSKQGMLEPIYCWLLVVCALRYRLTPLQISAGLAWMVIVFEILVPYSQYGRRLVNDEMGMSQRFAISVTLLSHPLDTRSQFVAGEEEAGGGYYNRAQGFWDRLTFMSIDDSLNNVTDQGRVFGYLPVTSSFVNAVPHFLYPDKPVYNFGNMFAHEVGGLPEENTTTGISFSPTAEAYHMGKWVGVLVVAPLVWALLFFVLDLLLGDLQASPWGLLAIAMLSHAAPETGIEGAIHMMTFGAEILTFCALFSTYVAPYIAGVALGRGTPAAAPLRLAAGTLQRAE